MIREDYKSMTFEFENIPLPFAYDALLPHIDELTMQLHHDKHLQSYINNLNAALKPHPKYHDWPLVKLLINLEDIPKPLQTGVQKNAGGTFNHFFFFEGLTPAYNPPLPKTMDLLNLAFGSFDSFIKLFKETAMSVFGSGYAWLVLDGQDNAKIITTANQDCAISDGYFPLLCVDVWEHAYYLLHHNVRSAYLDNFFQVANWNMVEQRLKS